MRQFFVTTFILCVATAALGNQRDVDTERIYANLTAALASPAEFAAAINSVESNFLSIAPESLAVDLLWEQSYEESAELTDQVAAIIEQLDTSSFPLGDRLRLLAIAERLGHKGMKVSSLREGVLSNLKAGLLDRRSALILHSIQDQLRSSLGKAAIQATLAANTSQLSDAMELQGGFRVKTKQEIKDLVFHSPNLAAFLEGRYQNSSKLFMFCRHDRNYPCRYILKDRYNWFEKNRDGSLWTQPSLGQSAKGLPYNVSNGYTPSGVYTIDSVMPNADNKPAFGNFRRFILNFVPETQGEAELKLVLPVSAHAKEWWKESVVARDIGRNQLRIHGTGKRNDVPDSTFYPHVKTSGCVSQLEGKYGSKNFKDQRNLLDMFMLSMGIAPKYSNETGVKGLLYVIELDNLRRAVTAADIAQWLDL